MRRRSIQRRLIAIVLASQLVLAAGIVCAGVFFTHRELQAAFDAALHEHATSVAALVRYSEEAGAGLVFERDMVPRPITTRHPDLFEVRLTNGPVIQRSPNWPDAISIPAKETYWNFRLAGRSYRAVRLENAPILDREGDGPPAPASAVTLTVIYAAQTGGMHEEVAEAGLYIGLASLVLLGATLLLTVWQIRRGLLPLYDLTAQAAKITPNNWDFHVPADASATAELAPLAQAITAMLEGLRRAFTQQREFLGNAAHELKTPVAILKSTMQSLLQRPRTSEEYRARLEESLEDIERLEKLLQSMLRIARAEQWRAGGLDRDLQSIDVAITCATALDRLRGLIQARQIKVDFDSKGPICLRADAEDLELIWVNLLENAIRYSPERSTVRMSAIASDGHVVVRVEDQGAGIPAHELAHVFERFHRGDASRARETGGYGLGLAIAKAVTEAYGGTISAESDVGRGTCLRVELPLN